MSKIALTGNASGTGTLTIAAPNTSTDRTLTLPDEAGTVLTSGGAIDVSASAPADSVVIDSSGNVGIGTSSPGGKLQIYAAGATTNFTIQSDSANIGGIFFNDGSNSGAIQYDHASDYMSLRTNGTERARIDSSGRLLVGTTSLIDSSYRVNIQIPSTTGGIILKAYNTGTQYALTFRNSANTTIGSIQLTNTATSYNTSSDYRLKENVVGVTGASARVQQLNPVRFNFIADPDKTVDGFLAHEVQDVVPEAITGTKDEADAEGNPVYQGIDQSKLVPLLTAALQEALTKIETLEARVAALEGN